MKDLDYMYFLTGIIGTALWLDVFTSGYQYINIFLALFAPRYQRLSLKQKILDS